MAFSGAVVIFSVVIIFFVNLSSSTVVEVTSCEDNGMTPSFSIECDVGSAIRIIKAFGVRVSSCNAYDSSLDDQCGENRTPLWAVYCAENNPCSFSQTSLADCSGNTVYGYVDYECIPNETTVPNLSTTASGSTPSTGATKKGIPDETTVLNLSTTASGSTPGTGATTTGIPNETTVPNLSTTAPGSTPSTRSPTTGFRNETTVPSFATAAAGSSTPNTRSTAAGIPETTVPSLTTTFPGSTIGTRSATTALPVPSHSDIHVVRRKSYLFRHIQSGRLQNHVVETEHGSSLLKCIAACRNRDDCVSFNIGKGVCELNNRVIGGTGVENILHFDGYKYYEKQQAI